MRLSSLLLGLVLMVALAGLSEGFLFNAQTYQNMFRTFITNFKKKYTSTQFAQALIRFKQNVDKVTNLNNAKRGATFAVNKFSDLDDKQFAAFLGARAPTSMPPAVSFIESEEAASLGRKKEAAPASFDWRQSGKNLFIKPQFQDSCGSCWAFTAITMLESAIALTKGTAPENLSEQHMLSCTKGTFGCGGGFYTTPLNAIKSGDLSGVYTEAQYPYQNKVTADICSDKSKTPVAIKIKTVSSISNSHKDLAEAVVNYGAIGIAMDANPIQFYKSGIYDGANCSSTVNHAMSLIGYGSGTDSNGATKEFYTIRNSWGDWWGEGGYFRMARSDKSDVCGVRKYATYVVVE